VLDCPLRLVVHKHVTHKRVETLHEFWWFGWEAYPSVLPLFSLLSTQYGEALRVAQKWLEASEMAVP
jgi:hypothetical protein